MCSARSSGAGSIVDLGRARPPASGGRSGQQVRDRVAVGHRDAVLVRRAMRDAVADRRRGPPPSPVTSAAHDHRVDRRGEPRLDDERRRTARTAAPATATGGEHVAVVDEPGQRGHRLGAPPSQSIAATWSNESGRRQARYERGLSRSPSEQVERRADARRRCGAGGGRRRGSRSPPAAPRARRASITSPASSSTMPTVRPRPVAIAAGVDEPEHDQRPLDPAAEVAEPPRRAAHRALVHSPTNAARSASTSSSASIGARPSAKSLRDAGQLRRAPARSSSRGTRRTDAASATHAPSAAVADGPASLRPARGRASTIGRVPCSPSRLLAARRTHASTRHPRAPSDHRRA